MTDDEIKKALECCIEGKCQLCPLYDNDTIADNCPTGVLRLCLDLINRKQADIERLQKEVEVKDKIYQRNTGLREKRIFDLMDELKTAKAEAIKELIDMIQDKSFMDQLSMDGEKIVYMKDIDNLGQEMINQII